MRPYTSHVQEENDSGQSIPGFPLQGPWQDTQAAVAVLVRIFTRTACTGRWV